MQTLNGHLDRSRAIVARLRRSGRTNPDVISLLLVETFFRSHSHRLAELAAWPIVWFVWRSRLATLSVGPGQIQLRHWRRVMAWESFAPTWSKLSSVLSWEASYDLVQFLTAEATTTQRRAAVHRGEARSYHVACLTHTLSWLKKAGSTHPGRHSRRPSRERDPE